MRGSRRLGQSLRRRINIMTGRLSADAPAAARIFIGRELDMSTRQAERYTFTQYAAKIKVQRRVVSDDQSRDISRMRLKEMASVFSSAQGDSCGHKKWAMKLGGWVCANLFCRIFIQYPEKMLLCSVSETAMHLPNCPPAKLVAEFMKKRKEKQCHQKSKLLRAK